MAVADLAAAVRLDPQDADPFEGRIYSAREGRDHQRPSPLRRGSRLDPAYTDAAYDKVVAVSDKERRAENLRFSAAPSTRHPET